MATRIEIHPDRYLIVAETIEEIEARFAADEPGAALPFEIVWGYGQHDPEPVWLRREEIKRMSPTVDRGEAGPTLE